jgi:hypothetical protein
VRIAVVLAGLVCMVVGAAIDRRGLGGWDLDSDIDRLTAGAAAVLVGAGLLALGSGRKTRVLTGLLAGAAIVPTAMAVTEAVDTGLPGPSTGVLAVGSAVVVLGVAARALEWKHGTASNRIRRIVAMVVAATATALAASAAAALVVDVPVQAVTTSAVQPAAVGVRADVVRWEWRGGGAMRDVRAAGAEELGRVDRAAGFPIAEVDGRIQLVAGAPHVQSRRWTWPAEPWCRYQRGARKRRPPQSPTRPYCACAGASRSSTSRPATPHRFRSTSGATTRWRTHSSSRPRALWSSERPRTAAPA